MVLRQELMVFTYCVDSHSGEELFLFLEIQISNCKWFKNSRQPGKAEKWGLPKQGREVRQQVAKGRMLLGANRGTANPVKWVLCDRDQQIKARMF